MCDLLHNLGFMRLGDFTLFVLGVVASLHHVQTAKGEFDLQNVFELLSHDRRL